jgi:hypothetical protein
MKSLAKTVSLNTQYQAKIAAKYNLQRKLDEIMFSLSIVQRIFAKLFLQI